MMCQSDSNQDTHFQFQRLMIGIFPLLLLVSFPIVYADAGFDDQINGFFDWLNDIISGTVSESNLPSNTETNIQNVVDSGSDAGVKGVSLWFAFHSFFVDLIFAGTDESNLPIDKDMIIIISMVLVAILGIILLKKLMHENLKLVIIIIFVILALAFVGLNFEF